VNDIREIQKTIVLSALKRRKLTEKFTVANEVCQLEAPYEKDFSMVLSGRLWLYYLLNLAKQL